MRLPESLTNAAAFAIAFKSRKYMERDEGKTCPCYEIIT